MSMRQTSKANNFKEHMFNLGCPLIGNPKYVNGKITTWKFKILVGNHTKLFSTLITNSLLLWKFTFRHNITSKSFRIDFKAHTLISLTLPMTNVSSANCKCEIFNLLEPPQMVCKIPIPQLYQSTSPPLKDKENTTKDRLALDPW